MGDRGDRSRSEGGYDPCPRPVCCLSVLHYNLWPIIILIILFSSITLRSNVSHWMSVVWPAVLITHLARLHLAAVPVKASGSMSTHSSVWLSSSLRTSSISLALYVWELHKHRGQLSYPKKTWSVTMANTTIHHVLQDSGVKRHYCMYAGGNCSWLDWMEESRKEHKLASDMCFYEGKNHLYIRQQQFGCQKKKKKRLRNYVMS